MNAQTNIGLSAAFSFTGQGVDPDLWDRFQTQLAADMKRRTQRERIENSKRGSKSEIYRAISSLTHEERAMRMEERKVAVLAVLAVAPATTQEIRDAIEAEHPLSREVLGAFLTSLRDKGLIEAKFNQIKSRRCALWFKK